jgi:hypothetical protein
MSSIQIPIKSELLLSMEETLSDLAFAWRGEQNQAIADEIVRQYQAILRCMIELGHHRPIDVESELPRRLMPREYLEILGRA